jgi:hypothetical protein
MRKQKRVKTIIETPHTLLPNQFKSLHKCGGQLRKDNYHFRRAILAPKIDQQIMFFQSRFLDLLFLIFLDLFH